MAHRQLLQALLVLSALVVVPAGASSAPGIARLDSVDRTRRALFASTRTRAFEYCRASDAIPRELGAPREASRLERDPGLQEGDWLYFDPDPVVLWPDYQGPVAFRNFAVLGDLAQVSLQLGDDSPVRRFERRERRAIEGEYVSFFDVAFPPSDVRALGVLPIRFDCTDPICAADEEWPGFFRVGTSTVPRTAITRINDRVQFSSHVVNMLWPYDGHSALRIPAGDIIGDFYRYFSDTYEEVAIAPARLYQSPMLGGWHTTVYSDVEGIGSGPVDYRNNVTSTLLGYNVFPRGDAISNWGYHHETGHMWGFYFELFDTLGIDYGGPKTCYGLSVAATTDDVPPIHAPLFADAPSYMSHCVYPPLRIENQARREAKERWVVAKAPQPIMIHPLMRYAMGILDRDDVPPLFLRMKQDRPDLGEGARVKGAFREVTIDDIVAVYGERRGSRAPAVWRRANIVVSHNRLLTKREMDWFNFFAKRTSDPDVTGIESLSGTPSTEVATGGEIDVQTEIRPRAHPQIRGRFAVSYPNVGKKDFVGVRLSKKLGTRYEVGRRYVISGRIESPGKHATVRVVVGSREFDSAIARNGRFAVDVTLDARDRGEHWLSLWLGNGEKLLGRVAPVYVE